MLFFDFLIRWLLSLALFLFLFLFHNTIGILNFFLLLLVQFKLDLLFFRIIIFFDNIFWTIIPGCFLLVLNEKVIKLIIGWLVEVIVLTGWFFVLVVFRRLLSERYLLVFLPGLALILPVWGLPACLGLATDTSLPIVDWGWCDMSKHLLLKYDVLVCSFVLVWSVKVIQVNLVGTFKTSGSTLSG